MAHIVRHIRLEEEVWKRIDDECFAHNCLSETGRTKGQPSPTVLLRWIALGKLKIVSDIDQGPAKPPSPTQNRIAPPPVMIVEETDWTDELPEPEPASDYEYADAEDPHGTPVWSD